MPKTLRILSSNQSFRQAELCMSPDGRSMYGFATTTPTGPRWIPFAQNPTGSQTTRALNPVPVTVTGFGWSVDGKYLLTASADGISVYTNNGTITLQRLFVDTPENVFGESFYPRSVSWFNDSYYFWTFGGTTRALTVTGCRKAFLCRYNPDTNTITVVDSLTFGADIAMLSLSPCNRWIASRQGNYLFIHNILPNRRIGSELFNIFTNTVRAFAWHPSGNFCAQRFGTGIRIYRVTSSGATQIGGNISDRAIFGWLNGGRTFVTITTTSSITAYDFNTTTGATSTWSGATIPTIQAQAKPDFANALVIESGDSFGSIMLIQHDTTTAQILVASESNDSKVDAVAPVAQFLGQTGAPNNGDVYITSFAPTGDFRANRNEYLTMDADSFAAGFGGEFTSLYGSVDMLGISPSMDNNAMILDEPFEPFEYRSILSPAFIQFDVPAGLKVTSTAADPFAYGEFSVELPFTEIAGTQPYNSELEASFNPADLSGSFGHVPDFNGDLVSYSPIFQAFAPLYPEGFGDFTVLPASLDIEGVVPSDIALLEAVSFLPEIAAEAFSPPAGMLDASVGIPSVEASGIVPVGAFVEASAFLSVFDGETFAPVGGFGEFIVESSTFEAASNVTTGVFLEAEVAIPLVDGLVNNPQLANGEFLAPLAEFDSFTGVGSEMALDAAVPMAQVSANAIFMYDAVLEASAMVPIFEGLPPEPVDVEGDFVAAEASADVFGGPWVLVDVEPVGPSAKFEGALLKAGQIDANLRGPRALFDGFANIQVTGNIDMLAEPTIVDIFAGQTVEASVEMFAPMAEANIRARFGEPADGETFVTAYHKKRRHGRAFTPMHVRF